MPDADREPLFQFRLRTLLVWFVFVSIAATAVVTGSDFWVQLMGTLTVIAFAGSLAMLVARTGATRAFYAGFVMFAAVNLLWSEGQLKKLLGMPSTNEWTSNLAARLHPVEVDNTGTDRVIRLGPERHRAETAGRHAVTIIVATIAGYVCRAVYVMGEGKRDGVSGQRTRD